MSGEEVRVIICRAVKTGITPGSRMGFVCSICAEPMAVTTGGLETFRRYPESKLICNDCGLLYMQIVEARDQLERVEISPEAKAQLDAGNKSPLARWMRRRA
jgi:hypothetical protein